MTNKTISITCDSDNHAALVAFSNALREMSEAAANPVIGELRYKVSVDTTEAVAQLKHVVEDTTPPNMQCDLEVFTPEQLENIVAVPSDVLAGLRTPNNYVHMYHAESNTYTLGRSDSEIAEYEAQGYVQHTREQYDAWEPTVTDDDGDETLCQVVADSTTLDKDGLPWDSRIHSGNKVTNADGTWRVRRKPKDMSDDEWSATLETVRAELKQLMTIGTHDATDGQGAEVLSGVGAVVTVNGQEVSGFVEADVTYHITVGEPVPAPDTPPAPPVVTPPAPPVAAVTPPPPVSAPEAIAAIVKQQATAPVDMTFPKLMTFLTERVGKITGEQVQTLCLKHGLTNVQQFNQRPDLIGAFVADVKELLGE